MLDYEVKKPLLPDSPFHVLVLHGLGDSMEGWKPFAAELRLSQLGYVFVNAPADYFGGFSWYRIPGMTSPEHTREQQLADFATSRELLAELVTHLLGELAISSEQLFLLGFSQGCAMVLDHALRSDRLYAGVVAISGYLDCCDDYPSALGSAAEAQQILWTSGSHDPVIPPPMAEAGREHLASCGISVDWRVYPKDHSLHIPDELLHIRQFLDTRSRPAQAGEAGI